MSESWWMALCDRDARHDLERAIKQVDNDAKIAFARDIFALRESLVEGAQGRFAVAIGMTATGVSDINAAAALVHDGAARKVVLVGRTISGSLRSRASRAGVDTVIDLALLAPPTSLTSGDSSKTVRTASASVTSTQASNEGHQLAGAVRAEKGVLAEKSTTAHMMPSAVRAGKEPQAKQQPALQLVSAEEPSSLYVQAPSAPVEAFDNQLPPVHTPQAQEPSSQVPSIHARASLAGTPVIVVSSGRGGVGKTSIAGLCALAAASWGMRVALVDLDLSCGNLFTLFGLPRPPALDGSHGMRTGQGVQAVRVGDVAALLSRGVHVAEGVMLWGPCARPELSEKVAPLISGLLRELSSRFDLVLIDTSATCTDAVAQAFQACSRLLLVHEEEPSAIGSLARTASLAVRLGVARTQIIRIANRGDRRVRFDLTVGRTELGLETARAFRLLEGGSEMGEMLAAGKLVEFFEDGGEPVVSLCQVLARILDDLGQLPDAAQGVLEDKQEHGRLFGILHRKAS